MALSHLKSPPGWSGSRCSDQLGRRRPINGNHQVLPLRKGVRPASYRLVCKVRVYFCETSHFLMPRLQSDSEPKFRSLASFEAALADRVESKSEKRDSDPRDWESFVESYAGTYSHPTYGVYELCLPPSAEATLASTGCARSDEYWGKVEHANVSLSDDTPALGVSLSAPLFNYMQLIQRSASVFSAYGFEITTTPTDLRNKGTHNSKRTIVYPIYNPPATIELSRDSEGRIEGFGMRDIWGAGPSVEQPIGETVRQRAEVWFERLN